MSKKDEQLTRRERQIIDILYRLNDATAAEVQKEIPDSPSYSTVRKLLSILETKGLVRHIEKDRRYVFLPAKPKRLARQNALKHLIQTFFDNSTEGALSAMIDMSAKKMSDEDYDKLAGLIEQKRKESAE